MLALPATLRSQMERGRQRMNRAFACRTSRDAKMKASTAREKATTGQEHFPPKEWANALIAENATELASIHNEAESGELVMETDRPRSRRSDRLAHVSQDFVERLSLHRPFQAMVAEVVLRPLNLRAGRAAEEVPAIAKHHEIERPPPLRLHRGLGVFERDALIAVADQNEP